MCKNDLILRIERQMIEDKLTETQGLQDITSLSTNMWWSSRQKMGETKGQKNLNKYWPKNFQTN